MAHQFRAAGLVDSWFRHADPDIALVANGVNGPLFERLVADVGFHDQRCVQFFREVRDTR